MLTIPEKEFNSLCNGDERYIVTAHSFDINGKKILANRYVMGRKYELKTMQVKKTYFKI